MRLILILLPMLAACATMSVPEVASEPPIISVDSRNAPREISRCLMNALDRSVWVLGMQPITSQRDMGDEQQVVMRDGVGSIVGVFSIRSQKSGSKITAHHSSGFYGGSAWRNSYIENQKAAVKACA